GVGLQSFLQSAGGAGRLPADSAEPGRAQRAERAARAVALESGLIDREEDADQREGIGGADGGSDQRAQPCGVCRPGIVAADARELRGADHAVRNSTRDSAWAARGV